MLFISILLSVWFGLWLMHAVFFRDTMKLFVKFMEYMVDETADDEDEAKEEK